MTRYASETTVPIDRSRIEIETTLKRYGATAFMYGWHHGAAAIAFEMHGRRIRFVLLMPNLSEFAATPTGRRRAPSTQAAEYEQSVRQRWRALALVIKAKLEAVESGITVFEEEFLAHIVLPNGATVGEWMAPQIENAYQYGHMPPLLPMLPSTTQIDS